MQQRLAVSAKQNGYCTAENNIRFQNFYCNSFYIIYIKDSLEKKYEDCTKTKWRLLFCQHVLVCTFISLLNLIAFSPLSDMIFEKRKERYLCSDKCTSWWLIFHYGCGFPPSQAEESSYLQVML